MIYVERSPVSRSTGAYVRFCLNVLACISGAWGFDVLL